MSGLELKAVMLGLLMAFGIVAPIPDFMGGMMLGLGACYGAMLFTPPDDRLTLVGTLFAGFLSCVIIAIAHPHLPFGADKLPIQLIMALAGAMSRWIGGVSVELGKGAAERARKLPSEFKLPGGKS
jgi:hypothetical protein